MPRLRILLIAVLAACALTLVAAEASTARGKFSWDAHWDSTLESRRFNISHAGIVKIKARAFSCKGVRIYWSISLYIDKPVAPDPFLGRKTVGPCGRKKRQTIRFGVTDTHSDYYFQLEKDLGPYWRARGVTTYPCKGTGICRHDDTG